MAVPLSRRAYAGHYGPTTGDRIRLASKKWYGEYRDADGVVYRRFGAHGLRFHPLASFGKLNAALTAGDTLQALVNPATRSVHLPDLPFALGDIGKITTVACGTARASAITSASCGW